MFIKMNRKDIMEFKIFGNENEYYITNDLYLKDSEIADQLNISYDEYIIILNDHHAYY